MIETEIFKILRARPSVEQEFLNWMLIKWRKASLEIKDFNLPFKKKEMDEKERQFHLDILHS